MEPMETSRRKKKTREEILEAKRNASKRRYEKIKADPALRQKQKDKDKENYIKAKQSKKKLSINEKTDREKERQREIWRDNSRKYYHKQKQILHVDVGAVGDVEEIGHEATSKEENLTDPLKKNIEILSIEKVNFDAKTLKDIINTKKLI